MGEWWYLVHGWLPMDQLSVIFDYALEGEPNFATLILGITK